MTRLDIVRLLDECIEKQERRWGKDYIYTQWERERKGKVLDAYDNGLEPIPVAEVGFEYDNGFDIRSVLYTDGSIRKEVYMM